MLQAIRNWFSPWSQVGPQKGSNPGGLYVKDGFQFYVKFMEQERCDNEVLANRLYDLAGIRVPFCQVQEVHGKTAVTSVWLRDLRPYWDEAPAKTDLFKGFGVDCWLANWDVVGLEIDNVFLNRFDRVIRLDQGGALLYRAMGAKKPLRREVTEHETFLDPTINRASAETFLAGNTIKDLIGAFRVVLDLDPEAIRDTIEEFGPQDRVEELFSILMDRRASMERIYEVYS